MLQALLLSQGLLWLVVIVLAIVCLALIRQGGTLYERIAPAGALAINSQLSGGDKAPVMSAADLAGATITIGLDENRQSGTKSQLLFFLSPSCPVCKTLLPVLKSVRRDERSWLDIVLVSDGDDKATHQSFIRQQALEDFSYIVSEPVGIAFSVSKLPYGVLIDEQGQISALGIVNSREHLESLLEAKRTGTPTIQAYLASEETSVKPATAEVIPDSPLTNAAG